MAVYEVILTETVTVRVRAKSQDEAMDWAATHTSDDVRAATKDYVAEYEDDVWGGEDGEPDESGYAIDITGEGQEERQVQESKEKED